MSAVETGPRIGVSGDGNNLSVNFDFSNEGQAPSTLVRVTLDGSVVVIALDEKRRLTVKQPEASNIAAVAAALALAQDPRVPENLREPVRTALNQLSNQNHHIQPA